MSDSRMERVLSVFHGNPGELISILQRIQEEFGYLPEEALEKTAKFLRLPLSHVYSVATFYANFHLKRRGDRLVKVCQGTACHVRGAREILEGAERCLGIKTGETTEDYAYSLERVRCVGACAMAPVVLIDDDVHAKMTPGKTSAILTKVGGRQP